MNEGFLVEVYSPTVKQSKVFYLTASLKVEEAIQGIVECWKKENPQFLTYTPIWLCSQTMCLSKKATIQEVCKAHGEKWLLL